MNLKGTCPNYHYADCKSRVEQPLHHMNHLTVLICEDDAVARQIVREHLDKGKVTYCNMLDPETDREALVASIETYEG